MEKAYLVLGSGEVYEGQRIGASGDCTGELVFTTGMVGYLETLTDPSYAGQIIMQTFPLIGNYGVIPEDFEGKCAARGYVVRHLCDTPSNFRSQGNLGDLLEKWNIPGICGVDTRRITRILREQGVMNACICDAVPENLEYIYFKVEVRGISYQYLYSFDGKKWCETPCRFDSAKLSDEYIKAYYDAAFTGAFVGMFNVDGLGTKIPADFDYFGDRSGLRDIGLRRAGDRRAKGAPVGLRRCGNEGRHALSRKAGYAVCRRKRAFAAVQA